jgi:hypothetical protein
MANTGENRQIWQMMTTNEKAGFCLIYKEKQAKQRLAKMRNGAQGRSLSSFIYPDVTEFASPYCRPMT